MTNRGGLAKDHTFSRFFFEPFPKHKEFWLIEEKRFRFKMKHWLWLFFDSIGFVICTLTTGHAEVVPLACSTILHVFWTRQNWHLLIHLWLVSSQAEYKMWPHLAQLLKRSPQKNLGFGSKLRERPPSIWDQTQRSLEKCGLFINILKVALTYSLTDQGWV